MTTANTAPTLHQQLLVQQQAYRAAANPSAAFRKQQLTALKSALLSNQQALLDALSQDYGHRSATDSIIGDILPIVNHINYSLKRLSRWMKPSKRHAGLLLAPASVTVHYQPVGVVGIVVPWNFPIMLSLGPLITAISAGNRAMIKMSEFTPATNSVLKTLLSGVFSEDQVCVIEGEADIAAAFTSLPFDHLIFTGSTTVGRHVMRAAADNLTPVTLELGGKSPVIIADDIDLSIAVERLIYGKCLNAGQICVAPDYILCPEHKVDEFIKEYRRQFQAMYRDGVGSDDYTSVIDARQFARLTSWLEDAKSKGAKVTPASDAEINTAEQRMPTQLITQVDDSMTLMQEEIFGPLLPILPYANLQQAIDYVNDRPRPLALYIMSFDTQCQQQLLTQTHSGGVCINETVFHVAADDAPFGGIGPSGMGHYHGKEGFLALSKAKTVLKRGKLNTGKLVTPPYGTLIHKIMLKLFLR
ncbi:coniferyl-aldehyde dehydrogenase [Sinobacterium caligoides]|uniref:Aldehyde dehydrogenase n=1 Tax=Sinobacterium caligoides TaxID=933926 RepID=A0A3N2DXZ6_9GAMM|nr:coniferyl aldehyde dehydrogenase [Sinobacterium caligoides]ROS04736.1 coniferyl-aldehyde dehydrogenase [Sinobacterium caligoides]